MSETKPMQPPKGRPWKRLRLIVYPSFQFMLIGVNAVSMLAGFAFVTLQARRSYDNLRAMGTNVKLSPDHPYYKFVSMQESYLNDYLLIAFVATVVVSSLLTLIVSHRLAGPLVRLKGYFREIASGTRVYPLKFRKGDFYTDLPGVVNEALAKLQSPPGAAQPPAQPKSQSDAA